MHSSRVHCTGGDLLPGGGGGCGGSASDHGVGVCSWGWVSASGPGGGVLRGGGVYPSMQWADTPPP